MEVEERRENYRWHMPLQTRWNDGDPYGHVNNAIYYAYFDTAVTTMLYERGVLSRETPAIGLCVESHCRFLAPLTFPETIEAGVRLARIGDKSLRYEVGLFQTGRVEAAASGFFVHVFVDRQTRRPVSLTPEQKDALRDVAVLSELA